MVELKTTSFDDDILDTTKPEFANMTIPNQIAELSKRLENVGDELHQQVRDKHNALLQQATHAGRFDVALNSLADDVERLRSQGFRLKEQVDTQYNLIENQTKVLSRLHDLSHLLRSSGTLLTLTAKLKNTKDVLKQSAIHFELAPLIEDEELKDIDFVQNERAFVIGSRQKIRNLTQMQLVTGLQERNEIQIINALKIFLNFNTLSTSLDNLIATFTQNLEQSLKECFAGTDISVLNKFDAHRTSNVTKSNNGSSTNLRGPGKAPQLTTTQNFRAKFWKSLHWLIYDELYENCEQVKLLKRALDQVIQFGHVSKIELAIQERFWEAVQKLLHKTFAECPAHVSQTLQEGLSKLLSTVRGLEQRLNDEFHFDNEIFQPLEVGYYSKVAANFKACLNGIDLPSNESIDNFIRIATTELSAALVDVRLTNKIAIIFVACGKELCTKLEAQIKLGADSKQVVDIPNIQQTQNIVLANILYYYKDSVRRMLQDLNEHLSKTKTTTARADINKSLEQTDLLIGTILQQLIESIISTLNIIVASMHREPGVSTDKISTTGPSMFMKELQEFISRSWHNHVEPFDDKEITTKCGQELAKRCIELFIHNLCILRPLSLAGRQRMKNDCMHLEQALKPICPHIADLGKSARLLRAISFLIVQKPQELIQQNIDDDSLVPSYLILFLLFGHASSELQSPHTTANWSNERLIEWLDGHTNEREKLELISGALQRYRDNVRRKNSEQYDEIYPMLVDYFEKAINFCT